MPQLDVISHITITQLQVLSPHQIEIHSGVQQLKRPSLSMMSVVFFKEKPPSRVLVLVAMVIFGLWLPHSFYGPNEPIWSLTPIPFQIVHLFWFNIPSFLKATSLILVCISRSFMVAMKFRSRMASPSLSPGCYGISRVSFKCTGASCYGIFTGIRHNTR